MFINFKSAQYIANICRIPTPYSYSDAVRCSDSQSSLYSRLKDMSSCDAKRL